MLPFSLHFNETTTSQVKKWMDLTVRYWSHNEVWVLYYTSLIFGHAQGKLVASKMMEQLKEDSLTIEKLCTLIRDGPTVNETIFNKEYRIEHYRNEIFALKSVTNRYSVLPCIIISGLVLAQMNVESEGSLSINARVVTKESSALGDTNM